MLVNRRTVTRTYTPKATVDINNDGVVDVNDDALVDAGDDFGFNEGIEFLWFQKKNMEEILNISAEPVEESKPSKPNHQKSIGTIVRGITNIPGVSYTVS